jgi:hypothetical protein
VIQVTSDFVVAAATASEVSKRAATGNVGVKCIVLRMRVGISEVPEALEFPVDRFRMVFRVGICAW